MQPQRVKRRRRCGSQIEVVLISADKYDEKHRFMLSAAIAGEQSKNRKVFSNFAPVYRF